MISNRIFFVLTPIVTALGMFLSASGTFGQDDAESAATIGESQSDWEFFSPLRIEADTEPPLVDTILTPDVFSRAKYDLSDLRLYDENDQVVPYSLRTLRPKNDRQNLELRVFNNTEGENGASELTIEMKREGVEHNRIEIDVPGHNVRRAVVLEGSDDQKEWRRIIKTSLVRFRLGSKVMDGRGFDYPPSRYRYLRVRVFRDQHFDEQRVEIGDVRVFHTVVIPGELSVREGLLGARQPTRGNGSAASSWTIDLGGSNVPCDSIEVEVDDDTFVRDYYVEALYKDGNREHFYRVSHTTDTVWQRLPGKGEKLKASFNEVQTSQLRLVVLDHANQPLNVKSVKFGAAARQLVAQRPTQNKGTLRLFFGNPEAESPHYDFARNLPSRLEPAPLRSVLESRVVNPSYIPPPLPFTERWPWLIYVVLGSVSTFLGVLIFNLSAAVTEQRSGEEDATAP